jgi:hypothetical protein
MDGYSIPNNPIAEIKWLLIMRFIDEYFKALNYIILMEFGFSPEKLTPS